MEDVVEGLRFVVGHRFASIAEERSRESTRQRTLSHELQNCMREISW
jgi:hypothetical protein